jgi:hypothetical protein
MTLGRVAVIVPRAASSLLPMTNELAARCSRRGRPGSARQPMTADASGVIVALWNGPLIERCAGSGRGTSGSR